MAFDIDKKTLDDLVEFSRIELESRDLEPWALMIRELYEMGHFDWERMLWAVRLYTAFDTMEAAWEISARWPDPIAWVTSEDRYDAAQYHCTQERRGLRGGKVLRTLEEYAHLCSGPQEPWLRQGIIAGDPEIDYRIMMKHLRQIWGVGRQTAFEWAEFLEKCAGFPIHAPDAELWESEGPRRSLQKIYGNPNPDLQWLNDAAEHARSYLAENGVELAWEDFETVICDFNVMRDGRYYPGRHLAALREEIEDATVEKDVLLEAWNRIVPEEWRDIPPGINKDYMTIYRETGRIRKHA